MDKGTIKALRIKMGLTQEEFAHIIGVTWVTVNRWEAGKYKPTKLALRELNRLAKREGMI